MTTHRRAYHTYHPPHGHNLSDNGKDRNGNESSNGNGHPTESARLNGNGYSNFLKLADLPNKELWIRYKTIGDEGARNALILKYEHLVNFEADRIHSRVPSEVEVGDLKSAGLFGLIDAVDGFDLKRGIKFETYAPPRIRGAILDELRSMDWVPRLVRARTAKVNKARREFALNYGREPTPEEIASHLEMSVEELDAIEKDTNAVATYSLQQRAYNCPEGRREVARQNLQDKSQPEPLLEAQRQSLKDAIMKGLNRTERLIMILYYQEEMTMKEIGRTIGLGESRISQTHSSIMERLRVRFHERQDEFAFS